jgi:DNA-directed RNA polymerase specialized sigma subunit
MQREKKERNKLIIKRIKRGDYQVDIAKDFNITPAMVCKIKKRLMKKITWDLQKNKKNK